MTKGLSLVMLMAGRGSRFYKSGQIMPKPLIQLQGRPFFWWAYQSVAQSQPVEECVFVVLNEHERDFSISSVVREYVPAAKFVFLDKVTRGAAETAALGIAALERRGAIAINDCDHAFRLADPAHIMTQLDQGAAGYLVGFRSQNPIYSFAQINEYTPDGDLIVSGTVEKRVVSKYAVTGCYLFASSKVFLSAYESFSRDCSYDEFFMSGVYNVLCARKEKVLYQELQGHVAFGTPEELDTVSPAVLFSLFDQHITYGMENV